VEIKYVPTTGYHYIFEARSKTLEFINDFVGIKRFLEEGLKEINATILNYSEFNFGGQGLSGVFLLAESHLSFHVWPKENYISLDLYTCGNIKIERFPSYLTRQLIITDALFLKRGEKGKIIFLVK